MDGAGLQEQRVSGALGCDEHALRNHLTELSVSLAIMRRAAADGDCGSDFDVNEHGDGARLGVGVRGLLSDNFEGWAKAQYADGGDFDGDFSGVLGAQVKFNQTWGLVGEVEVAEDINTFSLGLRASF